MMNKIRSKKLVSITILLLFMLLLAAQTLAIGVTPGKKIIEFESKKRVEHTITVVNTDYQDFRAAVLVKGELAPYITLSKQSLDFTSQDSEKTISYEMLLPATLSEPGIHEAEIIIRQIPETQSQGEIEIGSLLSVVSKVQVRVPYPGKYAQANLDIISDTKDVTFIVRATNLGQEDITKAKALINIYDSDNNLLSIVNTAEQELKTKQRKELIANWKANTSLGTYRATAIFDYDGVVQTINKQFQLGDFFLRPLDISVDKFKLGDVAKFDILIENLANVPVPNAQIEMTIFDKNDIQVAALKSVPETIQGLERKEINLFWITENIQPGTFHGKLLIKYGGKSSTKDIRLYVEDNKIQAEIIGITGLVVAPKIEEPKDTESGFLLGMLTTLVIILTLTVIILVVLFFRKKT